MSPRFLVACVLLCASIATSSAAATFTVNVAGDPPPPVAPFYTLRSAIAAANATSAADTIVFALVPFGSSSTITLSAPLGALPTISQPLFIDGWSQGGAGYSGPPLITLDGSGVPDVFGLNIQAANVTVRGLAIVDFPAPGGNGFGIGVFGSASNTWIYGCTLSGNGQGGIWSIAAGAVLIGTNSDGTNDTAERNVIHSNTTYGVLIATPGVTVAGNYIGLHADGLTTGQHLRGVYDQVGGCLIGGRTPAARNVIAASGSAGVTVVAGASVIAGNYLGLAADGLTPRPNVTGVSLLTAATGSRVGTDADGVGDVFERNVVSGNSNTGIDVRGSGNLVAGNYAGLSADGLSDRGNGVSGVAVFGSNNQIGGVLPAQRNVLSGNTARGVFVSGSSNLVQGNYIGTNAAGVLAVPNDAGGVFVNGASGGNSNTVGGATAGAGNVISGNLLFGVQLSEGGTNTVQGNLIGVAQDGVTALGNSGGPGVVVFNSSQNLIGGTSSADGNVVAFNAGPGVVVAGGSATGNRVLRNQIFSNSSVGLDLGSDGVTANDPGDGDAGPNGLQNFPVLSYAASDGGSSVSVNGTLDGAPGSYRLEFFAVPTLDPSGHGEGQLFVGTASVPSGAPFALVFPAAVPKSWFLSATATDPGGNTSELSQDVILQPVTDLELTMTDAPDPVPPATPLVYTLVARNFGPSPASGVRVVDALPFGVSLIGTTGCAEDPAGVPQCTLGTIAAGGSKSFTIQVGVQPSAPPSATNVAVVTGDDPDPVGSNNSATATTWLMPTGDLSVTVSDGSTTVLAGGQTTYTIAVGNAGPSALTGARVQDAFPVGLACAWTCTGTLGGVCTAGATGAIDELVDLPVGAGVTFSAVCQVAAWATGTITNTATVAAPASSYDPSSANNTQSDTDTVLVEADLGVTQSDAPDPAPVFGQITYTLDVSNAGPSDAADVTLTDTLPAGTSFVSSSPAAPACTLSGSTLTCTLGPLAAGANAGVTLVVQADPGTLGQISNHAEVAGTQDDPNPLNDTSDETTTVVFRKGDLDNDLQTDLLFRHLPDGHHAAWLMNGVVQRSAPAITPDPASIEWQLVGTDDFDGDHRNDLVMWNAASGQVEFWLLGGPTGTSRLEPAVPLSGATPLAPNWHLAATADFNADGRPDLVWRNVASQNLVIWTLGESGAPGTQKTGAIVPSPAQAVHANWEVVAALDFDGDSATDLLWYNSASGKIVQWLMDANVQRLSGRFTTPANAGDANWKVLAGGDYGIGAGGAVGTNDVVWRNASSGRLVVWHLDLAGVRTSGSFTTPDAPPAPATDWTVAGPR